MKDNTGKSKSFLQQALKELPDDFALSEVKFHVKNAILKLEKVEKNRILRERNKEQREVEREKRKEFYAFNPLNAKQTLNLIDEIIDTEKEKLKKKGEDFEPLFG